MKWELHLIQIEMGAAFDPNSFLFLGPSHFEILIRDLSYVGHFKDAMQE